MRNSSDVMYGISFAASCSLLSFSLIARLINSMEVMSLSATNSSTCCLRDEGIRIVTCKSFSGFDMHMCFFLKFLFSGNVSDIQRMSLWCLNVNMMFIKNFICGENEVMSKAEDILDKTKRGEPEAKKWKVVVGIVVGLVLAGGLLFGALVFVDVDGYLYSEKEVLHLYEFYEDKVGEDECAVFFLGSSMIGDSIYTKGINENLKNAGYDITSYCLVMQGDTPLRRTVQIQNIIDSSPSLVVIGVTYGDVINPSWPSERVILVHDKLKIRDDSLYLFSEDELSDFKVESDLLYKKSYIRSALLAGDVGSSIMWDYYTHPYSQMRDITSDNISELIVDIDEDSLIMALHGGDRYYIGKVPEELTRHKEALIFNVKTLQNSGIPVVIINMPLHPITSSYITDESRQNMYDLLNQTGAAWYDMERDYDDTFFKDNHHASLYGALQFTPVITDLIIQEMS